MVRRINAYGKGLLDVIKPSTKLTNIAKHSPWIEVCHRTVTEFLAKPKVYARLQEQAGADFNPHLCVAMGIAHNFNAMSLVKNCSFTGLLGQRLRLYAEELLEAFASVTECLDQEQARMLWDHLGRLFQRRRDIGDTSLVETIFLA